MALELQLANCDICKGYFSSTVLNTKDLQNPEIIDHYFYHGEPWFTLDKTRFDHSTNQQSAKVCIVNFEEHLKDDHRYCTCASGTSITNIDTGDKFLNEYTDTDIYFHDLYITYNNFHQDIPTREAI